ncbi:MAG: GDP-mannose 4,6-dehydratase [Actinomycetota bacterium]
MNETALVTGGAGFIGSTLTDRLLADGHDLVVLDNFSSGSLGNLALAQATGRLRIHEADIRSDEVAGILQGAHVVAHLAAQIDVRVSVTDPVLDASINILGTLNVLQAARAAGVRKVVVASSGGCIYGDSERLPITEDDPGRPASPYGISKKVLGDYLNFYRAIHGMDSAVMALSNVCGPRQDPHGEAGVVAIFLKAMLQGRETTIYGDGSQTRDFVFVGDVAEAFARATTKGSGVYNIGTGVQTSVLELWELCAASTGYRGKPNFAPARAGELQANCLDASRARRDLGWEPKVTIAEAVARTSEFIASQPA